MKKVLIFLTALLIRQNVFCAEIEVERVLTENSSIQSALTINYDMLIQDQLMKFAEQKIREANALFFPTVDLSVSLSEFNNGSPLIIANNASNNPIYLPAESSKDTYYYSRISVVQNLYTGGRIRAAGKLAAINVEKVKNESNKVKNEIILKVKTAFNKCLYYQKKIDYFKTALNKNNTAAIKQAIDLAQLQYDKSVLDLLSVIGLELNTIISIDGEFAPKIKNITLNQCLLLAYRYKPEIQMTQHQESIDELGVNLLSMQRYPTVVVGAAQEWTGRKIIDDNGNWYIFLTINLPVFDGGGAISRVLQGKIVARQAALERSKTESLIKLAVNKSFIEYNFWKQRALENNLYEKQGLYNEAELEIVKNLNESYFNLELDIGVQLDNY
ncbi:MAG: TolC family protein [Elusimicrobiota bacterium]|jgi:outer membrane protein TolC|nr:TolC family protein [Elusimicrobiota bacterium]